MTPLGLLDSGKTVKVPVLDKLWAKLTAKKKAKKPKGPRIRCPKCSWQPKKRDRWWCHCGHSWNTFDTAGLCPACSFQWAKTACLSCHKWSAHRDWYVTDDKPEGAQ